MTNKNRSLFCFLVILALLIFGIYYNILDNPPTDWDDPALFTRASIHGFSLDNLKQVLSFHKGSTYQPIRDISYMIDFTIWGDNVVFGMHLHSILLYYLMTVACWMFLMEVFKAFSVSLPTRFTWAALSTLIFAVHPVHVESIAWLYARKEPLLGIFTFLSLWAFIKARSGRPLYYMASGIALLLAILSKPTALIIPGVMIVFDLALMAKEGGISSWKKRIWVYLPIFILVIPMIIRLVTMMSSGGIKPLHGGSFWTNLLAVSQIFITYISLIGLTIHYVADYSIELYTDPQMWQAWAFMGANIILISSAVLAFFKGGYLYAIFVAWFYIFLIPVSHIIPIGQIMADRYALIPSLSWCVMLGFLFTRLLEVKVHCPGISSKVSRPLAIAFLSIIVISYGAITIRQNDIWQDSQTLWENTIARYPDSTPANANLSWIYMKQGRYKEAAKLCINAIKKGPYDYVAINNLALVQMRMGQHDNAIQNFKLALKLKPDYFKAKLGLVNAYWEKKDFANVYTMYPDMLNTHNVEHRALGYYRIGYAAWKLNKKDEATQYMGKACALCPNNPVGLNAIGQAYREMGETAMAIKTYKRLLSIVKNEKLKEEIIGILEVLKDSQPATQEKID